MKKIFLYFIVFLSLLNIVACSNNRNLLNSTDSVSAATDIYDESLKSEEQFNISDYAQTNGYEFYAEDFLNNRRYLLTNEVNICLLTNLGEVKNSELIPLHSVSDVGSVDVGSFVTVKITDNAGKEFTVSLDKIDFDRFSKYLNR